MNMLRNLVAHVVQINSGSLEVEEIAGAQLQARSELEFAVANAILASDEHEWRKKGHDQKFQPTQRQADVAVRHARAAVASLLAD